MPRWVRAGVSKQHNKNNHMRAKIEWLGRTVEVDFTTHEYTNGGLAVRMHQVDDEDMEWTLSSWMEGKTPLLPPGVFYVAHWKMENEAVIPQLVAAGVLVPTQSPLAYQTPTRLVQPVRR